MKYNAQDEADNSDEEIELKKQRSKRISISGLFDSKKEKSTQNKSKFASLNTDSENRKSDFKSEKPNSLASVG